MKKKRIGRGAIFVIIGMGLLLGDVQLQIGTYSPQASTRSVSKQVVNFQNISWSFFRSPGESLDKELADFKVAKHSVDLRTYDFTHKEFKETLKMLAQSGVNVRIIVEDKKFQQFQNTLKVLSQYFSWYKNIQLKSDKQMGTEYTHAKVNLIDSGFIIQTANLTNSSFASNREHYFQSFDTGVWTSLHRIF